ncbi:HAD-IA family hydrolase [Alkalibaculum sp. M08DMB]|uniref:HAD-IA family hydrolase n=1 Tax=Alkalibaculum sporogenes TaxID=2655001 RepID=A0A6A7K7N1_9FIRM|nr:HAD-IA family hydrolase [Alkalibaculum sporogenes]MPW25361.1 HAD-IA family hydrolase [Alkalibaculum sporogenes]
MHYKCIIFDFDGTLADTENQAFTIYNDLADKYKYKKITREDLHSIKHLNFLEIIKLIEVPYTKIPKLVKEGQRLLKASMETIMPFQTDIKESLLKIRDQVNYMGIITSNTKKNVNKFVKNQNIDFFDFVESSPLLGKEKKINYIRKKYGLEKHEVIYIGDETRDIIACRCAEIECIAVTWGYNYLEALEKENPDFTVDNFSDILEILKSNK